MKYIKASEIQPGDRVYIDKFWLFVSEVVVGPNRVAFRDPDGLVVERSGVLDVLIEDRLESPEPKPKPRFTIEYQKTCSGLVAAHLRSGGAIFRYGSFHTSEELALSGLMNRLVGNAQDIP